MNKALSPLMNAEGSVIVFTLMVLILLTIVGIATIHTASTEVGIAGAELIYQRNFYWAEGAAMEAANWLEINPITIDSGPPWMEMTIDALNDSTIDQYWAGDRATKPKECAIDDAWYLATFTDIEGQSLEADATKLREISIYGRTDKRGVAEVRLGYRKYF